ncbi:NUDIX domain-containing protein [Sulfurovum sp. zt1-1]|uniref:NUDIX domain-containing protein n=1 Tax=Sulfurovum zhangzhouensis TaxID=3019067 RepID=A0ABT7QX53_9BACT|nr:NUDIX domain-containing protein [Sulfurovum zhangzhouensis]MDM5271414.1 NUDIX domain-containing protein [Sulfurovum zhangzhouensis]
MKNEIKSFQLKPLEDPKFITTSLATYQQNGIAKSWEIVEAHDSVAILIYHKTKDAFVLVQQFRPAVYLNNNLGLTIELCAGIVDKNLSLMHIASEEIEEECGYRVTVDQIEKITSFHTSVGFAGSKQMLYYTEVDESVKVSEGGGVDDEQIEVIYLPVKEAKSFIFDETVAKTPGLMFAFMWWFENKNRVL